MEKIDAIWKADILPALESQGLMHMGKKLVAIRTDVVLELEPEPARFNNPAYQALRVNLKAWIVNEGVQPEKQLGKLSKIATLAFNQNVGLLWDEHNLVYEFHKGDDPTLMVNKIIADCQEKFMPRLENITNLNDFLRLVDQFETDDGKNPFAFPVAVALAETGRKMLGKKYFNKSIGFTEIIQQTAASFGIDL